MIFRVSRAANKQRTDVRQAACTARQPCFHAHKCNQSKQFIHGAGYYFDNSPYHFTYDHPEAFRHLHCTDPAVMKTIDSKLANDARFHMAIFATVLGADAKTQTLHLRVDEVQLKDDLGNVLIDQKAS